jgi:hypothetical protein
MIRCKPGVWFDYLRPEITGCFPGLNILWAKIAKQDCVITAAADGRHKDGSLHYVGLAIDLRSKNLAPELKRRLLLELRTFFGPRYDIILESEGKAAEHYHLEYDPKV